MIVISIIIDTAAAVAIATTNTIVTSITIIATTTIITIVITVAIATAIIIIADVTIVVVVTLVSPSPWLLHESWILLMKGKFFIRGKGLHTYGMEVAILSIVRRARREGF